MKLIHGDCLERMKDIPDKSIDMILCDLPYGVLNKKNPAAKWDSPLSLDALWGGVSAHHKRQRRDCFVWARYVLR